MSDLAASEPAALAPEVAALLVAQRRELRLQRRWVLACRFASLAFAAWYLEIIIIEGKDSAFYIFVNLWAVVTGLSGFIAFNYFDPPLLIRNLHGPDEALRQASWEALQPLRGELLPTMLQDLGIADPDRSRLVAEIDLEDLRRRTAPKLRGDRKRLGRIWLAIYLPCALAFIYLVATWEAGP
jgi:hypothetical protein